MEQTFLTTLDLCYCGGINLDFIVVPDIMASGKRSLDFSLEWATGRLKTAPNLALAVQDGLEPHDVAPHLGLFTHLFVGGSVEWKWSTVGQWVELAHSKGLKCHVGQVGKLDRLELCESLRVDSIDSTSWPVNSSWHIVEAFTAGKRLF